MPDISPLVGQDLASVEFTQDHLVLHFGADASASAVTFYVFPDVFREEGSYAYGEPEYRNVLCAILGEEVTAAALRESESLEIEFESGVIFRVSLREEDLDVPVAGHFSLGSAGENFHEF